MSLTKVQIRKNMAEVVRTLTATEIAKQSSQVMQKVIAHPQYIKSQRVSVYLSTESEINTTGLLENLFENSKRVFVPRFDKRENRMDMVRLESMDDFRSLPSTTWNIKQPRVQEQRENALETGGLDLVITPGVAFTIDGKRLGHGKGYYDTFFHRHVAECHRKPYALALAFREQVLDDLIVTDHDYLLDEIIFDVEI